MSLVRGDHIVKLNPTTKEPIKFEELYVEFEVVDIGIAVQYSADEGVRQFALLKVVH